MILDEILAHKRTEVAERKARRPESAVRRDALAAPPPRDFRGALVGPGVAVIAEVKRASPAKGALRLDADAPRLAARYVDAGAAAVSVLTDERYFKGCDADLVAVRGRIDAPVLRKEFIFDPYQVYEARALGADAVLLIVRALTQGQLIDLKALTVDLGMAALVEIHTEQELEIGLAAGADLIGINNRDLTRMVVDLETTRAIRPRIPSDVLVVSESGIRSGADVRSLTGVGVDAVLVGESLVTAPDPGMLLQELIQAGRAGVGASLAT